MRRSALLLAGSAFSLVLSMSPAWAKPPSATFGIQKTIQVPNGLRAFDISFCDDTSQLCFVFDQTNKAIDIINARDDSILGQFVPTTDGGFVVAGPSNFDMRGPDGVLEAHNLHQLWVRDGKSRVWVIDIKDLFVAQCGRCD